MPDRKSVFSEGPASLNEPPPDDGPAGRKKAGPLQVALAVFWSFFGVRKKKNWQDDAASITPAQAVIGGLVGAAIFIFVLVMVVRWVVP